MLGTGFTLVVVLAALMLVSGIALIVVSHRLKPESREPRRRYILSRALLIVGVGILLVGGILACDVAVALVRIG